MAKTLPKTPDNRLHRSSLARKHLTLILTKEFGEADDTATKRVIELKSPKKTLHTRGRKYRTQKLMDGVPSVTSIIANNDHKMQA